VTVVKKNVPKKVRRVQRLLKKVRVLKSDIAKIRQGMLSGVYKALGRKDRRAAEQRLKKSNSSLKRVQSRLRKIKAREQIVAKSLNKEAQRVSKRIALVKLGLKKGDYGVVAGKERVKARNLVKRLNARLDQIKREQKTAKTELKMLRKFKAAKLSAKEMPKQVNPEIVEAKQNVKVATKQVNVARGRYQRVQGRISRLNKRAVSLNRKAAKLEKRAKQQSARIAKLRLGLAKGEFKVLGAEERAKARKVIKNAERDARRARKRAQKIRSQLSRVQKRLNAAQQVQRRDEVVLKNARLELKDSQEALRELLPAPAKKVVRKVNGKGVSVKRVSSSVKKTVATRPAAVVASSSVVARPSASSTVTVKRVRGAAGVRRPTRVQKKLRAQKKKAQKKLRVQKKKAQKKRAETVPSMTRRVLDLKTRINRIRQNLDGKVYQGARRQFAKEKLKRLSIRYTQLKARLAVRMQRSANIKA
jgi:hypothetical protein